MPNIFTRIQGTFIENPIKLDDGGYEFSLSVDPGKNYPPRFQKLGTTRYVIHLNEIQKDQLLEEIEKRQEYTIDGSPYLGVDGDGKPFLGIICRNVLTSDHEMPLPDYNEPKKSPTVSVKKVKTERFDPKRGYQVAPDAPVQFVSLSSIRITNPIHVNARLNPNKYRILLEKVQKSNMIPEPLIVQESPGNPDTYDLLDGLRRLRVAEELNFSEVPIVVVS